MLHGIGYFRLALMAVVDRQVGLLSLILTVPERLWMFTVLLKPRQNMQLHGKTAMKPFDFETNNHIKKGRGNI